MTAINLDAQIVGSSYDPITRICSYTYEHPDGARYTVKVEVDEFQKIGTTPATREVRRKHLAMKIQHHINTHKPDHA